MNLKAILKTGYKNDCGESLSGRSLLMNGKKGGMMKKEIVQSLQMRYLRQLSGREDRWECKKRT
jgi:hypothetical protein